MADTNPIDKGAGTDRRSQRNWRRLAQMIEDGTLGGGGLTATNFVFNGTPSGTVNGVNAAFTLANTPTAGTVAVYVNGLRQHVGSGNDYTISGSTITFEAGAIPLTGDVLIVDYLK